MFMSRERKRLSSHTQACGFFAAIYNHIPMHIPVKLELKYVGANPVSNDRLTSYTFKESDFDPKKGGDMVVTYDDESQISLSKGTLKFNQVTLSPGTVTNLDNSAKADGTGKWLDEYGNITGPVTMYAIYTQKIYFNLGVDNMNTWTQTHLGGPDVSQIFRGMNYDQTTHLTNIHVYCYGGCNEMIYVPIKTVTGKSYTFHMQFCNPNGYVAKHSSGIDVIASSVSPTSSAFRQNDGIANPDTLPGSVKLGKVQLPQGKNPAIQNANLSFTARGTTTWIVISWYAQEDGSNTWIQFGNFCIEEQRAVGKPIGTFTDVQRVDKALKEWRDQSDGRGNVVTGQTKMTCELLGIKIPSIQPDSVYGIGRGDRFTRSYSYP